MKGEPPRKRRPIAERQTDLESVDSSVRYRATRRERKTPEASSGHGAIRSLSRRGLRAHAALTPSSRVQNALLLSQPSYVSSQRTPIKICNRTARNAQTSASGAS